VKTRPIATTLAAFGALALLMVFVTQLSAAEPDAVIISTFDAGDEDWEVIGNLPSVKPVHVRTGGNPGGFIQQTDVNTGPVWYWVAPAKFQGNRSTYYNGMLSFDLFQLPDVTQQIDRADVILRGQGVSLEYDTPANPGTTWTHYVVPLNNQDGRWMRVTPGAPGAPDIRTPATEAEFRTVLSSLGTLRIRGEYREEGDTPGVVRDTGGLDNVALASPGEVPPTPTVPRVRQSRIYLPLVAR
jgi:hypothetical protein